MLWKHLRVCARDGGRSSWEAHVAAVRAALPPEDPDGSWVAARNEEAVPCGADLGTGRVPIPGEPQHASSFDAAHDLACLLANAEAEGIAVTWCEREVELGGFVYRPREREAHRRDRRAPPAGLDARSLPAVTIGEFVVVLNSAQNWMTAFDVLLHEVAHVLLGHQGPRQPLGLGSLYVLRRGMLGYHTREIEAVAAASVAAWRRGHQHANACLWGHFFAQAAESGELAAVDLRWVFCAADILAAWCRVPPDVESVRAVGRPRPGRPGPALGTFRFRSRGELPLDRAGLGLDDETLLSILRERELVGRRR